MKKLVILIVLSSLVLVFGCKSNNNDKMTNAFRVGVKYACPLKLLTENIYKDNIHIYLDGGSSYVDELTGKWQGHGAHFMFIMPKTTGSGLPTGTFSIGDEISEASYCEDFNNVGPNYNPVYQLKEGILTTSYANGKYTLDFCGFDTQDSVVLLNFSDGLSFVFDYSDEEETKR